MLLVCVQGGFEVTPEPDYYVSHFDDWVWRVMCAAMEEQLEEEEALK